MTHSRLPLAGLCWLIVAVTAAMAPPVRAAGECEEVMPLIEAAAERHGLDAGLMAAIISIESKFKSVVNKRSGARGLMQVMPSTARRLKCGDLNDTADNLDCGAVLLRRLLDRYDGSLLLALSGYHSGLRAPNTARDTGVVPTNTHYFEKVLATRTQLLREGCP